MPAPRRAPAPTESEVERPFGVDFSGLEAAIDRKIIECAICE